MRIEVRRPAAAQIRRIDAWWREHRAAAPGQFREEYMTALGLLQRLPAIGPRHPHAQIPNLRRLLLPVSQHHLYYIHEPALERITILAVWASQRGQGPPLG